MLPVEVQPIAPATQMQPANGSGVGGQAAATESLLRMLAYADRVRALQPNEAGAEAAPGALAASPRPAPRPRRTASAAAAPAAVAAPEVAATATAPAEAPAAEPAAAAAAAVKSASVASGTALVQIGAFDSDAIAGSEWDRVSGRYSSLFAGKSPVVQKHEAGGRTFWRLRVAGFAGRDDARKFCAALIEAGGDCIPAVAK